MSTAKLITAVLALVACSPPFRFARPLTWAPRESSESQDPNWIEGKKAIEAKNWKQAVALLSKAAAAEPKNADVQNWLGFAQRKSGNLDAAFAAYNEALKLNPEHKSAHEYIGEAYLMTGRRRQGRAAFGRAAEAVHTHPLRGVQGFAARSRGLTKRRQEVSAAALPNRRNQSGTVGFWRRLH